MKINEISVGATEKMPVLINGIEERQTNSGGAYCVLSISDGDTIESAKLWKTKKETICQYDEHVVIADINAQLFNGSKSYVIKSFYPAGDEYCVDDFKRKAPVDRSEMYNDTLSLCLAACGGDAEHPLYRITESLYAAHREDVTRYPAAKANHHAFIGGLLYHSYRMVKTADALTHIYTNLNPAIVVCAAALHDIGKLIEMTPAAAGNAEYTIMGSLVGHIVSGEHMVVKTAESLGIDPDSEEVMLLRHAILAHHGKLEYGSPVVPQTPEALVLHYCDMIDASVEEFTEEYESVEPGTMSDSKVFALGTRIYRPTADC